MSDQFSILSEARTWPEKVVADWRRFSSGLWRVPEGDIQAAYSAEIFPKVKAFTDNGFILTNGGGFFSGPIAAAAASYRPTILIAEMALVVHFNHELRWRMKNDPMLYESRFFHFLNWVISEYGVYLFMAFVFLCPFIIWWVHRWARKHPEANVRPDILIYWIFPPRDR